jgi:UDP-3-O-[3-hydroxymyristoyl] glucosamine N-acyltransferase
MVKQTTVGELAAIIDGFVVGDGNTLICGISSIEDAQFGDVTYAETARLLDTAAKSGASAIIAPQSSPEVQKPTIRVKNPRFAFAQVLRIFAPEPKVYRGIHPTALIAPSVRLGKNVSIHANSIVGENCTIGDNVVVYPFVYIGDDVVIGNNCVIYPQVVLHDSTEIGSGVVIHSGSILGTDGFGYMFIEDRHYKIPQIGQVIVGDDVEIGANVTIDRARTGSTRIGSGTKIDNLVHIGHNCTIGEHCVIVAQVGISGSVELGKGVILAGQVGVKDHITIGDGAIVGAKSGVMGDVPAGAFVSGHYARPHLTEMRNAALGTKLPDMFDRLKELERRLAAVEGNSTPAGAEAEQT